MKAYLLTIPSALLALAIQAADIQAPPPAAVDAASANVVSADAAIHRGNQETQAPEATLVPIPALDWRLPKKYATIEGDRLIIDIPADAFPADAVAEAELPAALFDGAEGFSMAIDAEGKALAKPTKGYLGLKFQFHLKESATGREAWPNTRNRIGDFPLGELRNDTTFGGGHPDSITLMLGLQGTSGRVEFDLSTLRGAPSLGLFQRINQRVDEMMQQGLMDEVRSVYALRHLNSLNTVGYKELFKVLDGEWELPMAVERIKKNTRVYAKKQMTWFKHDTDIHWLNLDHTSVEEAISFVKMRIKNDK